MKYINLPGTDLSVSELSYGMAGFGTDVQDAVADQLLAEYLDAGGNFLDTAHCYGFWVPHSLGASEREVGRFLRHPSIRDRVIVATKGGHSDGGKDYRRPDDFLAENVLICDIENSLYRLGLSTIDLYYLHRDDGKTPVEEVIEVLNRQIRKGHLRYIAASNWSVERITAANAYAKSKGLQGFVASQIQGCLAVFNFKPTADPTHRYLDAPTADWHRASGMPVIPFSATANGYFSDNPTSGAIRNFDNSESQARRDRARQLGAELGCTPIQIALAYLLCQDYPVVPIFSTTKQNHLTEILGSVNVTLTPEQLRWLEGV